LPVADGAGGLAAFRVDDLEHARAGSLVARLPLGELLLGLGAAEVLRHLGVAHEIAEEGEVAFGPRLQVHLGHQGSSTNSRTRAPTRSGSSTASMWPAFGKRSNLAWAGSAAARSSESWIVTMGSLSPASWRTGHVIWLRRGPRSNVGISPRKKCSATSSRRRTRETS